MSIVIDSSVVVAALLDSGPQGEWAEEILSCGLLQAPNVILVEVTNILRRLEGAKLITSPEANASHEDLVQLDIELFPFEPFAGRIWELRRTLTGYGAWYVAIAEALQLPLATVDEPFSRSKGVACSFLRPDF